MVRECLGGGDGCGVVVRVTEGDGDVGGRSVMMVMIPC